MYNMDFVDPTMTTYTLLRQTWTAVSKIAETKLAKVGLTPEKAAVLWACRDYPGILTPAEISRLVAREAQSIAGLLNRMEKEGLVKRVPKRKGRPYTEIRLTPRGEELCDPGVEVFKGLVQNLTTDMSDEERQRLHDTLNKLRLKVLDQLHIEPEDEVKGLPGGKPISLKW